MSTMQRINDQSLRDPDALEREVEATRRELAHTMDLLGQRLSPGQLADRVLGASREHGGEFARNLGATAKYHPLPVLLTAVGIGWLALADSRPPPVGADGNGQGHAAETARRMRDAARAQAEHVSGAVRGASQRVRGAADALKSSAAQTGGALRDRRERAREGLQHTLHEQPLVLGAVGVAVGALLGGILPRTRTEDRTVGEYGERLRERAADAAHDARDTAARSAEAARDAAMQSP